MDLELCLPRLEAVLDGPSSARDMTNRIVTQIPSCGRWYYS